MNLTRPVISSLPSQNESFQSFMRSTYLTMAGGLGVTAFISWWMLHSGMLASLSTPVFYGLMIAELVFVIAVSALFEKLEPGVTLLLFLVYAALNGATMAPLFLLYNLGTVYTVFGVTAGVFGVTCVWSLMTRTNLANMSGYLTMALIGLIISSVVNIFLHNDMLSWLTSLVAVFVFTGITAFHVQRLRTMHQSGVYQNRQGLYIYGALSLYLDFINLFINLLRLLGGNRSRN